MRATGCEEFVLHDVLKEEAYMRRPRGYENLVKHNIVSDRLPMLGIFGCRLKFIILVLLKPELILDYFSMANMESPFPCSYMLMISLWPVHLSKRLMLLFLHTLAHGFRAQGSS
jgi:hypothetical protein